MIERPVFKFEKEELIAYSPSGGRRELIAYSVQDKEMIIRCLYKAYMMGKDDRQKEIRACLLA